MRPVGAGSRWSLVAVAAANLVLASSAAGGTVQTPSGAGLVEELGCAACHPGLDADPAVIRSRAPSLANTGDRYSAGYLLAFLQAPSRVRQDIGVSRMPSFQLDEAEALALAEYLASRRSRAGDAPGDASAVALRAARDRHPAADADLGRQLFGAFQCGACHDAAAGSGVGAVSPDLRLVGRFQPGWLGGYLAAPAAVRPFGVVPGTGSRMPDFRLQPSEAAAIAEYLVGKASAPPPGFRPAELTAFSADKAKRLLRDRWPCLGCHQLDGEGGRIGPDLSGVGARLRPGAIRAMIENPHRVVPGAVMSVPPLPADRVDLAASYLAARRDAGTAAGYLSPVGRPFREAAAGDDGAALYARWCANCHGDTGNGDGYNAPFLPVPPTHHADSAYLSTRPDDTLYDGIAVGGFILNRSHRMPGFGSSLTADQIRTLVAYLRTLCRCQEPAWARDNR